MKNNLSWDEYFMGLAVFTSFRSKDPNSKVGAVIVDHKHNHIIGTGYNGFVSGVNEAKFTWERDGDYLETKYPYVIHAEANAIMNSVRSDLSGCRLYVTLTPCCECAKLVAQKGISKVYYLQDKYHDQETFVAARKIFDICSIETEHYRMDNFYQLLENFRSFYPGIFPK